MAKLVDIVTQHPYETLDSAVSRALYAARKGVRPVHLSANIAGRMVEVGVAIGDSSDDVIDALKREAKRTEENEKMEEQNSVANDGQVPTDGEHVAWAQLHPILREVVLASLRKERENYSLGAAVGHAQQIAVLSSMGEMMEQQGARGQVMMTSMTQGMAQSMKGAQAGQTAVRAAFDVAIARLEALS